MAFKAPFTQPVDYDAGDEVAVAEAQEVSSTETTELELQMRHLLKQRQFRTFLWNLLNECGTGGMSYHGDKDDMLVNEGRRSAGLWALAQAEVADPYIYATLIKEGLENDVGRNNG